MRYRHPPSDVHPNGLYGGIGSRAAPEVWTPGTGEAEETEARVPSRLRKLRLRPNRRYRDWVGKSDAIPFELIMVVVIGAVVFAAAFSLLMG